MPRQARRESGTGIFHVMMRGINHQDRRTNRRMSELRVELAPAFPSEKEEDEIKQEQRQSLLGLCLARRRKTKSIEEQTVFATPVGAVYRNFSVKV